MFAAATKTGSQPATSAANYIEDVFSTYLYTGNGSSQTIENGIALGTANSGGSLFFTGSATGLEYANTDALKPSGNFTIEAWINSTSYASVQFLFNKDGGGTGGFDLRFTSGAIYCSYNGNNAIIANLASSFVANQWYHIALCRNSSTTRVFVNGVYQDNGYIGNITSNATFKVAADNLSSNSFKGYLSNFRFVNGTALYPTSDNFTPSTTPLTAVTNTVLLIGQAPSPITDNSINGYVPATNLLSGSYAFGPFTSATAGKGGMTWIKSRSAATNNNLFDTTQGATKLLHSNTAAATVTDSVSLTSFNSNGFTLGTGNTTGNQVNTSAATYASWTFAEQEKFFDIVTYTGNGSSSQTISHNLGSVPGMIIVKATDGGYDWGVYHRSLGATQYLNLDTPGLAYTSSTYWADTNPTSTTFTVAQSGATGANSTNYVAYLFAHDAGGFGTSGTDNVISCGSYAGGAAGNTINLGFEPQFVLIKGIDVAENWLIFDNTRGIFNGNDTVGVGTDPYLVPNTADAETSVSNFIRVTSTGFALESTGVATNNGSYNYLYMAIRRGPMKTPTSGTSVFSPVARSGTGANATISSGFLTDTVFEGNRASASAGTKFGMWDRQRKNRYLISNTTAAEVSAGTTIVPANSWDVMDGYKVGTTSTLTNASSNTFVDWIFKRAPGFHDLVCYTGTGTNRTVTHNLGVAPELIIIKRRNTAVAWMTYSLPTGADKYMSLNSDATATTDTTSWNNTSPTSSVFTVGVDSATNQSSSTYVAYLFATCPGVSKVGSYTGTGATQTINCGFTGGARFVLIKRTDSTGDWYVWDTARGMVAGTDPSLLLNSTAAEVNANSIYTATTGFQIVSTAAGINASGGTYIFLAIA